ncbi:MAG: KamA family radical SAM protein [Clostridiaceae bacterium]|nr:KamA family radical SAM protein [Clostridiaceae bacterium]
MAKQQSVRKITAAPETTKLMIENRMARLHEDIADYMAAKEKIPTGMDNQDRIKSQKEKIKQQLGASEKQWNDYRWQLANRFTQVQDLAQIIPLNQTELSEIRTVAEKYRFAISPYYLSLIDPQNPACPIRRQAIPSPAELDKAGELDPMDEAGCSPEAGITRRYPDRLIIKVTNQCGMYCRFCQRRRLIGEKDLHTGEDVLERAVAYIAENPEIRDVLLTGGDALMLSDSQLEHLLAKLRAIPHVEIIRIGTRTPVTLPQRITPALTRMLRRYHPLYVNTHFNSPAEITLEALQACSRLADAGIPLGNQMVLLQGVNNDKYVVRKLNQQLLRLRVKPYYIFHPKQVRGTSHFWVRLEDGLEIMESLRGYTSGLAIPTYIVNGSGGLGKTPLIPNYLLYIGKEKAFFRNWEGQIFEIDNQRS